MRSKGLGAALAEIKDHLKGLSKTEQSIQLTKMFGAKSSQAILTLLGNLQDYDRTVKQVARNSGRFDKLAAAQAEDATAKWAHFKSAMSSAAILLGNQLLPVASRIADKLAEPRRQALGALAGHPQVGRADRACSWPSRVRCCSSSARSPSASASWSAASASSRWPSARAPPRRRSTRARSPAW